MTRKPTDTWPPEIMLGCAVALAVVSGLERIDGRNIEAGLFIVGAVIALAGYLVLRRLKGIEGQLLVMIKSKRPDLFE